MKKTVLVLIAGILMMAGNIYAEPGNLIVEGNANIYDNAGIGIGTSTPGYRLTVQGAVNDGMALLNQSGEPVSIFDTNAAGAGRFRLYDFDGQNYTEYIRFVAGGAGYFKATNVDFMDNSGNSLFKIDANNGYAQLALTSGAPPANDCDDSSERGRMKVDSAAGSLYICVDSGWVAK
jgi:hypothetical protein